MSPGRGAVVLEQRLQRWRWTVLSSSSRTMVSTSARTPFFAAAKGDWHDDNRVANLELLQGDGDGSKHFQDFYPQKQLEHHLLMMMRYIVLQER